MKLIVPPTQASSRHNIPLFIRLGDIPVARTRNLSLSGIFVETLARPAVDTRLPLEIVWGDDSVHCTARVVRHAEQGIGVAFEQPDALFAQAIGEILADSQTQPPSLAAAM